MRSEMAFFAPRSLLRPVVGRDHIQGRSDAPFALLQYGDYGCLDCGEAYPVIKAIQEQLGDQLCFAFRNFPMDGANPLAQRAAGAAEAAGAQGRYWEMHDMLFENQEALEDDDFARYALALELDEVRIIREILSGAHAERVREDFRSGVRCGVNSTPAVFINGVRFKGAIETDSLLIALEARSNRSMIAV
jgi:protein-disulfide isomerase